MTDDELDQKTKEFEEGAYRIALQFFDYGKEQGWDVYSMGAAGKMMFEAVEKYAAMHLLEETLNMLKGKLIDAEVDMSAGDLIKEAEGVLRNDD